MHPSHYRRWIASAMILTLFCGCGAKQQYTPKIQLTQGDTYVLIVNSTDTSTMNFNSNQIRESHKMEAVYKIEVKEAHAEGGAILAVTYKTSTNSLSITNGGVEISAFKDEKGRSISQNIATIAEGHTFTIELAPDGSILKVFGLDDLQQDIKDKINVRDYSGISRGTQGQIEDYEEKILDSVSAEQISMTFGEIFTLLPSKPVAVGETWNLARLESIDSDTYSDRTVAATRVEGNNLHARITAIIGSVPNAELQMTGKVSGEITIDLNTGLVMKQSINESSTGSNAEEGVTNISGKVTTTIEILKM